MRKLSLNVDSLLVESFAVEGGADSALGTVKANENTYPECTTVFCGDPIYTSVQSCWTVQTCMGTCMPAASCQDTCSAFTCGAGTQVQQTCAFTCGGIATSPMTCVATCQETL